MMCQAQAGLEPETPSLLSTDDMNHTLAIHTPLVCRQSILMFSLLIIDRHIFQTMTLTIFVSHAVCTIHKVTQVCSNW